MYISLVTSTNRDYDWGKIVKRLQEEVCRKLQQ